MLGCGSAEAWSALERRGVDYEYVPSFGPRASLAI